MPRNYSLLGPTGSLTNNIYANSKQIIPVIGMGATELMHTDRHAFTIVEVISPKEIVVQRDNAIRTDNNGMSDSQGYRYEPNPEGEKITVTLRKNGRWVTKGGGLWNGTSWAIDRRDEHYDYSF